PPMTPIEPVFAIHSSSSSQAPRVRWNESAQPIPMRSNTEDTLLPRWGEKGDDFWFSMVAHSEEKAPGGKGASMWLRKTRSRTNRLSKWVWFIGLILRAIGAVIGSGVCL
ncbi:hypothetical protein FA13DRAFT_1644032, partial [Coprinellus micaceus]